MNSFQVEFQHALLVADRDRKKIREVLRKTCIERRKISLLLDEIWKRFREKVIELVDIDFPHLWGHFRDGVLRVCDEVCGKKNGRRCKEDTLWWKEDVKEAV